MMLRFKPPFVKAPKSFIKFLRSLIRYEWHYYIWSSDLLIQVVSLSVSGLNGTLILQKEKLNTKSCLMRSMEEILATSSYKPEPIARISSLNALLTYSMSFLVAMSLSQYSTRKLGSAMFSKGKIICRNVPEGVWRSKLAIMSPSLFLLFALATGLGQLSGSKKNMTPQTATRSSYHLDTFCR